MGVGRNNGPPMKIFAQPSIIVANARAQVERLERIVTVHQNARRLSNVLSPLTEGRLP